MSWRDRDYMREHRREFYVRGNVVFWLIGITVATFLVQATLLGRGGVDLARIFGVVPSLVTRGALWQFVTHAFLHSPFDVWHLIFNMLFLYWLGTDVAEVYGVRRFLLLYFGGAIACGIAHTAAGYISGMPDVPGVGASGAILAVSVVASFLYPTRIILVMMLVPVPLWLLVSIYVGIDLYYPLMGLAPWVSSAGHLGGAAFGAACHLLHLDAPGGLARIFRLFRRSLQRDDRPSKDDVDRILDKINAEGIGSLTDRERDVLRRASR